MSSAVTPLASHHVMNSSAPTCISFGSHARSLSHSNSFPHFSHTYTLTKIKRNFSYYLGDSRKVRFVFHRFGVRTRPARTFSFSDSHNIFALTLTLSHLCSSNLVVVVVVVVVIGSLSARGNSPLLSPVFGNISPSGLTPFRPSRPKPVRRRSDTGPLDSWPPRSSVPATGTVRAGACETASPARCSYPGRRCSPTRSRSHFPR